MRTAPRKREKGAVKGPNFSPIDPAEAEAVGRRFGAALTR